MDDQIFIGGGCYFHFEGFQLFIYAVVVDKSWGEFYYPGLEIKTVVFYV